jgi:hypothetical protein
MKKDEQKGICCEKCICVMGTTHPNGMCDCSGCSNHNCECHLTPDDMEVQEDMKEQIQQPKQKVDSPAQPEWEKEFDRKFGDWLEGAEIEIDEWPRQSSKILKSFIHQLLNEAREKERDRIVKMCEGMKNDHCGKKDCLQGQCVTRHIKREVLEKVIQNLKSDL